MASNCWYQAFSLSRYILKNHGVKNSLATALQYASKDCSGRKKQVFLVQGSGIDN